MQSKLIIVEDKENDIQLIESYLHKNFPDIQIVGKTGNVFEAIKLIQNEKPDIVLLDVNLEGGTAFNILDTVVEIRFKIIFITAEQDKALRGYDFAALHYLTKPFSEQKFVEAMKRCREMIHLETQYQLLLNYFKSGEIKEIIVPIRNGLDCVNPSNIMYYEVSGNTNTIFFADKKRPVMVELSGRKLDDLLISLPNIIRVHQSYSININYVDSFNDKDSILIMRDKKEITLSKNGKRHFQVRMEELFQIEENEKLREMILA